MEISAAFVIVVLAYDLVAVLTISGPFLIEEFQFSILIHSDPCAPTTIADPCPHIITQNITRMLKLFEIHNEHTIFVDACWLICTYTLTV